MRRCAQGGISEATYYNWRRRYGVLCRRNESAEQLEESERKLKRCRSYLSRQEMLQYVNPRKIETCSQSADGQHAAGTL